MTKIYKNEIYTVSVFEKFKDISGMKLPSRLSVMGYFITPSEAEEAVLSNWADIQERSYKYALIERIEEGLYNRKFYEWNGKDKAFHPIPEPKGIEYIVGFSMR